MAKSDWIRVTRNQRCPVCSRDHYCLIAKDGTAVICTKIESRKRVGAAGWLHKVSEITGVQVPLPREQRRVFRDLGALAMRYRAEMPADKLSWLADGVGLDAQALSMFGVGWVEEKGAWSFPMQDERGKIIGIRLRLPSGRKFSVTGGHEGLFVPKEVCFSDALYIAEGATDAVALTQLGLVAVGRPNCSGGVSLLKAFCRRHRTRRVVIVADSGVPGLQGARSLARSLSEVVLTVCVIEPPARDMRAWLLEGANRDDVLAVVEKAGSRF